MCIRDRVNTGQLLQRVQQGCRRRTQQRAGLAGDNRAVCQLNGGGRLAVCGFRGGMSALFDFALPQRNARLRCV